MRLRLSYANVVATLALFVALGGSSYAAIKISGKQVRNGTLTGKDVRDGALRAKDFRAGDVPAGPRGLPGAAGPTGPRGPSEAFNQGLFPGGPGLQLTAGSYLVTAHVKIENTSEAPADITCTLVIGDAHPRAVETVTVPADGKATVPLQQIHAVEGPGVADVSCDSGQWNGLIIGVRLDSVSEI